MKKSKVQWYAALAILAVVYCVVVFAVPFHKDNAIFWISFIFTLMSLAAQIYVMHTAFGKESVKSRFYGFPIARIGVVYLAVQLILGIIFMAFSGIVPAWASVLVYVILAGVAALGFISADATRDEIERQDKVLAKNVSAMRSIQSKASSLVGLAQSDDVRQAVEKLSESLRFSDPVSNPSTGELEGDLSACVDELQKSVVEGDSACAIALVQKAENILIERNRQCKLNK